MVARLVCVILSSCNAVWIIFAEKGGISLGTFLSLACTVSALHLVVWGDVCVQRRCEGGCAGYWETALLRKQIQLVHWRILFYKTGALANIQAGVGQLRAGEVLVGGHLKSRGAGLSKLRSHRSWSERPSDPIPDFHSVDCKNQITS